MNNTQKIILELYDKQLFKIYKDENLKSLEDQDLIFDGKNIHLFYYDIINSCSEKEVKNYDILLSDIINCSKVS